MAFQLHSAAVRLAAVWMVLVAAVGTAQADSDNAKTLFERATVQFRLAKFHEAALTYQRVYELHPDAVLLYNCAQSYRLANEPEKALVIYKSYLSAKPDASNREEVEGRIAELERVVAGQRKPAEKSPTEPAPPTAPPQPAQAETSNVAAASSATQAIRAVDSSEGRKMRIAGFTLLGVAVGAVVGGAVTAVLSGQASDSVNAEAKAHQPFDPSKESQGKTDQVVSGVMFGVAGAAAVAGAVLVVLGTRERRAHESKVSLLPALSPGAVGAIATVRF
jgi:tetratricopeptide (TPR) repeat protein